MIALFWRQRSIRYLTLALAASSFSGYALIQWMVSLLMRETGATVAEAGAVMLVFGVSAAAIGSLAGGVLSDHFGRRDDRAYAWVPAVALVVAAPAVVVMCLAGDRSTMLLGFFLAALMPTLCTTPVFSLLQRLVSEDRRALAAATILMIMNLVGLGCGPIVVGAVSDMLASAGVASPLRYALLSCAVAFAAGALFSLRAAPWVVHDLRTRNVGPEGLTRVAHPLNRRGPDR
jgi:MFS family permease